MLVSRDGVMVIRASTTAEVSMLEMKMAMGFVKCM
jgi:hypothetical protein